VELITAGELKKRGVSILEDIVTEEEEVVITVRGKKKYVVLDLNTYNRFREYELEVALAETKRDLEEGNVIEESVEEHIKRIRNEI
jgi:PHD/YefM family antitoxin component YafN of YafNO toxin-antitoxin module